MAARSGRWYTSCFFSSKHTKDPALDAKTPHSSKFTLGALVTEGKTKRIYQAAGGSDLVTVISKIGRASCRERV